jgi:tRNA A-37 threonylcarbamoyl transferase component Bud32
MVHARIMQNLAIAMDASELLMARVSSRVGSERADAGESEPQEEDQEQQRPRPRQFDAEDQEQQRPRPRQFDAAPPPPPPPAPATALVLPVAVTPQPSTRPPPPLSPLPPPRPDLGPTAEALWEESSMLAKIGAFTPAEDEIAYRSSACPQDEWENDHDDGFLSVPVSLDNFLTMETRSLIELESSGGFPLDAFASDLWREARASGHPCTDAQSLRKAGAEDGEGDGNSNEDGGGREDGGDVDQPASGNPGDDSDDDRLLVEYERFQHGSFLAIMSEMPFDELATLIESLRGDANDAWDSYWLECGEDLARVPALPLEELPDLRACARSMGDYEACQPILRLAGAMCAALELHSMSDREGEEGEEEEEEEEEEEVEGEENNPNNPNDVSAHSELDAGPPVWEGGQAVLGGLLQDDGEEEEEKEKEASAMLDGNINSSIASITGIDFDQLEVDSDEELEVEVEEEEEEEEEAETAGDGEAGQFQKNSGGGGGGGGGGALFPMSTSAEYGSFSLRVVFEKHKTGFEQHRELRLQEGRSVIAGRYRYVKRLGEAAFSIALECVDLHREEEPGRGNVGGGGGGGHGGTGGTGGAGGSGTGAGTDATKPAPPTVCLKMIKNNKEYVDQSLDEIRILSMINSRAEAAGAGGVEALRLLKLHDYFYFREHLFIVTEKLGDNLYEFGERVRDMAEEATLRGELTGLKYFTLARVASVARQLLTALGFLHGLGMMHCDLKPENVLVQSMRGGDCRVKLIDFGSTCFGTDRMEPYIQSRVSAQQRQGQAVGCFCFC